MSSSSSWSRSSFDSISGSGSRFRFRFRSRSGLVLVQVQVQVQFQVQVQAQAQKFSDFVQLCLEIFSFCSARSRNLVLVLVYLPPRPLLRLPPPPSFEGDFCKSRSNRLTLIANCSALRPPTFTKSIDPLPWVVCDLSICDQIRSILSRFTTIMGACKIKKSFKIIKIKLMISHLVAVCPPGSMVC